jgi:hypothetical protein
VETSSAAGSNVERIGSHPIPEGSHFDFDGLDEAGVAVFEGSEDAFDVGPVAAPLIPLSWYPREMHCFPTPASFAESK